MMTGSTNLTVPPTPNGATRHCSVHIATGIVDELRLRAGEADVRHDSETVLACAEAVAARVAKRR
jgi:hypothetical protein